MAEKLLEVKNLYKYFPVKGVKGPGVQAVENVSLFINKGETLGLVGESGCGKTTLGKSILQLVPVTEGSMEYKFEDGFKDLRKLPRKEPQRAAQTSTAV